MAEFVSSFITGFQDVVSSDLPARLGGCKIIDVFDGLVHYSYSGNSRDLEKILYFNNTFFVIKTVKGNGLNFPSLVGIVGAENKKYIISRGTFRVRFVNENQFAKVDKNIARRAEETVIRNSKLFLDRVSPSTEIWYSIRREGFAFCGQLISKREFTEKNLNKGELRPEIAYLLCCFTGVNDGDVVLDPFCGFGSIPIQLVKHFRFSKLFISDIDKKKIDFVSEKKQFKNAQNINIRVSDAFSLNHIKDKSVNIIITDPPWGFYEDIGDVVEFYNKMFESFKRVLAENGTVVVLSARKEELEKAVGNSNLKIVKSLHTLVNGKKAGVYKIGFYNK